MAETEPCDIPDVGLEELLADYETGFMTPLEREAAGLAVEVLPLREAARRMLKMHTMLSQSARRRLANEAL